MITNIYIRIFLGTWSILLGAVLGKIYLDREKDNWFGRLYRSSDTGKCQKNLGINPRYVWIAFVLLPVVMGIIVLLFGVRETLVGVP